jgi:hypothetical protein
MLEEEAKKRQRYLWHTGKAKRVVDNQPDEEPPESTLKTDNQTKSNDTEPAPVDVNALTRPNAFTNAFASRPDSPLRTQRANTFAPR